MFTYYTKTPVLPELTTKFSGNKKNGKQKTIPPEVTAIIPCDQLYMTKRIFHSQNILTLIIISLNRP